MEQYVVSARKYRPDSFETLIGQDNIVRTLKNSIVRGQLAHAYLFCGPRGVGKTSAARIFAKIINCENPTAEMEPCGQCESCISFQEGRSFCIHELDAASNNGVDDIKLLMEQVQIPPQVGKYSVYIIDEVHMLSQSAFNAFLKTLEEPPAHAIFILATTEKHKILPTILSRCQTYDFNRISVHDIVYNLRNIARLENITIDDESLHLIAGKADGAMRDALTIFDQTVAFCGTDVKYEDVLKNLNILDYEHCFRLTDDFLGNDCASALLEFDGILSKGFNALYFVSALSSHFRNLMVSRNNGLDSLLELPDSLKERYREQAGRCTAQFLYDALNITTQCESGYKQSINPRLHIEFALMKLSYLKDGGEVSVKGTAASVRAVAQPVARPSSVQPTTQPAVQRAAQPVAEPVKTAAAPSAPAGASPVTAETQAVSSASQAEAASPTPVETPSVTEQSAPQVESPTPAPRRRGARAASALSLSAIMGEDKAGEKTTSEDAGKDDRIPGDEEIMSAWKKLPEAYVSQERLSHALATFKTEIMDAGDHKELKFYVVNAAQQKWMAGNILKDLEGRLHKALGSSRLKILIDITPDEKLEAKPYMPEEKARALMAENEEVRNLVHDLDLDIR